MLLELRKEIKMLRISASATFTMCQHLVLGIFVLRFDVGWLSLSYSFADEVEGTLFDSFVCFFSWRFNSRDTTTKSWR